MSVTITLTEANLQAFPASVIQPKGFELYRLSDDQAGDGSGGDFTYDVSLNGERSSYPGFWTVVDFRLAGSGALFTRNPSITLSASEPFEKWNRWVSNSYPLWVGELETVAGLNKSLAMPRDDSWPLYLGRPVVPPANTAPSAGRFFVNIDNVGATLDVGLQMVLARADKPVSWPKNWLL